MNKAWCGRSESAGNEQRRLRKLAFLPCLSAILIACAGGLLNPMGMQLMWQSALPATVGGDRGLLWLPYYIPKGAVPEQRSDGIGRNYHAWVGFKHYFNPLPRCCPTNRR
jgi:hypothetical protein